MKNLSSILLFLLLSIGILNNISAQEFLVLTQTNSEVQDGVIGSIVPDNNYGLIEDLHVYNWTQGGIHNIVRSFIEFDLSLLPDNAVVHNAQLQLNFNTTSAYGDEHSGFNAFFIENIITPWDEETLTWNTQPQSSPVNRVEVAATTNPQQNKSINVTPLVEDMLAAPGERFGFMFKHTIEEPYKVNLFASSNHADSTLHPILTIEYTVVSSDTEIAFTDIVFYPNPSLGDCQIDYGNGDLSEIEKINITDINGRLIQTYNHAIDQISIAQSGIYFVEFIGNSGSRVEKLIRQ